MLEVEDGVVPATVMGVVEVVGAVAAVEVMMMTMTTTTMTPRLRPWRDRADVDVGDEPTGSSTMPRCNNWL